MDEWSILDEVDVVARWPADHKKAVLEAGAKWKERKEGLEALNTIIEQNPRLSTATMTIYGELMDEIRKILDRESNIVVVTTAIRTVELLAKGLRSKFAGFIGMVVPFLIKRAKDKKKNVRVAILAAMAAVADTTSAERLQKDVIEWFGIPSPESKQTLLAFLFAYWCRQFHPDIPFVKAVAPLVVKASSESDVTVRDKACQALGALKRLMGDAISAFLVPISAETAKMEKIQQYVDEAAEEFRKFQESQPKTGASTDNGTTVAEEGSSEGVQNSEGAATSSVMDPWDISDPEDVAKKIDKSVESQLLDKNWKERVAGGESVKKSMDGILRIELSERLLELLKTLIKIIEKDVNVNVAALAAQILTDCAKKARFSFASIAHRSFPVVFDKLKDKKAVLRDALVEYCDEAANTTPLSAYSESVITALGSKNPQTRQQTALFLARFYAKNDTKTVEIDVVKQLGEHILKTINDADKEVREAALRIVAAIQKSLGETVAKRLMADVYEDKLKAEKIPTIIDELVKEYGSSATPEMLRLAKHYKLGSAPSRPPPTAARPASTSSRPASTAARPASTASRPPAVRSSAPSAPAPRPPTATVTRRAPSPKVAPPTATVAPKKFVARPAPNFGTKPRGTVAPTPAATVPPANQRPGTAGRAPPTSASSSSRPTSSGGPVRIQPVKPNVVRHTTVAPRATVPPGPAKPIGIARPMTSTSSGAPATTTSSRSRIAAPSSSRPGTASGIARPPSNSRIARPPGSGTSSRPGSRPASRNE
ncbi:hypothetical protein B9Z55_021830 [Caenorhabditis nigoni]|uniref:TOG domain-containing protein n=1 Tax=Caenorhabditis nigoni TaxID=1611254 RepID=A0A2G5TU86_9PELO|nr:hypothetical protein B9Z55_021830 [Caenorhabditis nigoni]